MFILSLFRVYIRVTVYIEFSAYFCYFVFCLCRVSEIISLKVYIDFKSALDFVKCLIFYLS